MRKIAIINQKGGVGKTTTTVNLGAALARRGQRVLLVDLDPQGHLTLHLGLDLDTEQPTTYDMLTDGVSVEQARRQVTETLWCIGSHIELAAAEPQLAGQAGRELILRDLLQGHSDPYDVILMDCPPSLGLLTLNGLAAAQEVFIPIQAHFLALQGMSNLLETVNLVRQRCNPQLRVTGIILCMFEAGTRLAAEVVDELETFLETTRNGDVPWADARLFQTRIRRNIKLAEAPSHGQTIFDYASSSNGAFDYEALATEVTGGVPPVQAPIARPVRRQPDPSGNNADKRDESTPAAHVATPHGQQRSTADASDDAGPEGGGPSWLL